MQRGGQTLRLAGIMCERLSAPNSKKTLHKILDAMDLPSIDGVNTWFASKAAAERGYKVALSGVGGDELFHGYRYMRTIPREVKWGKAIAINSWRPVFVEEALRIFGRASRPAKIQRRPGIHGVL